MQEKTIKNFKCSKHGNADFTPKCSVCLSEKPMQEKTLEEECKCIYREDGSCLPCSKGATCFCHSGFSQPSSQLESDFKDRFSPEWWKGFGCTDDIDEHGKQGILSFISSREEKAREEGRKEAMMNEGSEQWKEHIITQYKEELLGKLPEELNEEELEPRTITDEAMADIIGDKIDNFNMGWNQCLSEVKKLLKL